MKINGFNIKYSTEELCQKINEQMRKIELIDKNNEAYSALPDGDKKALNYLANAARIMNDVALEMDHPLNLTQKQALETFSEENEQAALALKLFNSLRKILIR